MAYLDNAKVFLDPVLLAKSEHQSGEDVVHVHHQRNRFPHAPSLEQLRTMSNKQQLSTGIAIPVAAGNTERSSPASSNLPSKITPTQATAADSKLDSHPTKFHSCPFRFRQVIQVEQAKLIAQCDCTMKNLFPPQSTFLDVSCTEIFSEALIRCENVPPGKSPPFALTFTDQIP